jgi:uncharacterized membrane protein YphA (DoxX/SURF4 family)
MNISTRRSTTVMRVAFGLMATLAGLDKFFHILVDWDRYLSPFAAQMLPVSPSTFMGLVGVIEIVVGVAILTVLPVMGAYIASAWLLLITGNLVLGGHFDIAVRDAVLSISAFGLARYLEAAGQTATERHPMPGDGQAVRA